MLRKVESSGQKKQRTYYSGKKKRHTLKAQVVVNQANGQIISTQFGKGKGWCFRFVILLLNQSAELVAIYK